MRHQRLIQNADVSFPQVIRRHPLAAWGSGGPFQPAQVARNSSAGSPLPQADPIVTALTAHDAHLLGRPEDAEIRRRSAIRLESMNDRLGSWGPVRLRSP
ncbi:hypothetical protein GCM10010381_19020 [Streptomyces xantholiticus]|nr:hypothetical protein GCM10010381_19020 [Streptomyces xantholiticus]